MKIYEFWSPMQDLFFIELDINRKIYNETHWWCKPLTVDEYFKMNYITEKEEKEIEKKEREEKEIKELQKKINNELIRYYWKL
jgi:hypothetical protein